MLKYIEVTGKSEEEAIEKALVQLALDRDDVSVEIIERAKKGILGLGGSPARIRVSYEVADEAPVIAAPPVERPAPVPEPAAAEEGASAPAPAVQRAEKVSVPASAPAFAAEASLGEEVHDEKSDQIRAFLQGLMTHLESGAQAQVYLSEKNHYKVLLVGGQLGQLIGRRGETLDAIQQLTNYAVNRGAEHRVRIHIDAENYRAKREQTLQALARKVAGKVVRLRRNVTLEPMNAYERHVIHSALQDYPGVTTASIGTEPNRRVVVHYTKTR